MGQPMVLPKFELPGDKPHWAVRAAWISGGLLLASGIGLGAVIVHHRNLENQVEVAKAEAIAKVKAEAEAKIAAKVAAEKAAVAEEKARKEGELSAKLAARSLPATTVPGVGAGSEASAAMRAGKSSSARRGQSSRGKSKKALFRPGDSMAKNDGKKVDSKPASNKPDPIDELLRKMK